MDTQLVVADVVAILEERPHSSAELAALFAQAEADVHKQLLAFQRAGQVKRVGWTPRWAHLGWVSKAGRRHSVDRAAAERRILELVAAAPTSTVGLQGKVGCNKRIIDLLCQALERAGKLQRTGRGGNCRWILPGQAPATLPRDSRSRIPELLAEGPLTNRALAERLGITRFSTIVHLRNLERAQVITRVGRGGLVAWALASWMPPTPPAPKPSVATDPQLRKPEPTPEVFTAEQVRELENLEPLEDDEPEPSFAPREGFAAFEINPQKNHERREQAKRLKDPKLRQLPTPAAAQASWWVGISRDELHERSVTRAKEMSESIEGRKHRPMQLQ